MYYFSSVFYEKNRLKTIVLCASELYTMEKKYEGAFQHQLWRWRQQLFSETIVNIYHIIQRYILFTDVTTSRFKGLIIALLKLTNIAPKPFAGLKPTSKQMERCSSKLQYGEVQHIQKDM